MQTASMGQCKMPTHRLSYVAAMRAAAPVSPAPAAPQAAPAQGFSFGALPSTAAQSAPAPALAFGASSSAAASSAAATAGAIAAFGGAAPAPAQSQALELQVPSEIKVRGYLHLGVLGHRRVGGASRSVPSGKGCGRHHQRVECRVGAAVPRLHQASGGAGAVGPPNLAEPPHPAGAGRADPQGGALLAAQWC